MAQNRVEERRFWIGSLKALAPADREERASQPRPNSRASVRHTHPGTGRRHRREPRRYSPIGFSRLVSGDALRMVVGERRRPVAPAAQLSASAESGAELGRLEPSRSDARRRDRVAHTRECCASVIANSDRPKDPVAAARRTKACKSGNGAEGAHPCAAPCGELRPAARGRQSAGGEPLATA